MAQFRIPANLLKSKAPEAFAPGSLILMGYIENQVDEFQIALRVGAEKDYFALSPLMHGHVKPGSISSMYSRHVPLFGIDADDIALSVHFDVPCRTSAWPGFNPTRGGFLAFGPSGPQLLAWRPGQPWEQRTEGIDLNSWQTAEKLTDATHWLTEWILQARFKGVDEVQSMSFEVPELDPEKG